MKTFGHVRPVRDEAGNIIGSKPATARRVTRAELGGAFGLDGHRRLVVSLAAGDVITFRPERTRQEVSVLALDCYRFALRCKQMREAREAMQEARENRHRRKERAR
jgi:hypothetical protein